MTKLLNLGELAPWFHAPVLDGNPRYAFSTVGGRWIVMLFIGSAGDPAGREALALLASNRALFDDESACFFGVTTDPSDAAEGRIAQEMPGIRWVLDYDRAVSSAYGSIDPDAEGGTGYRQQWLLLDPMMRVAMRGTLADGEQVLATLGRLPRPPVDLPAPALVVPRILPPELCRHLIERYEADGGRESGFMREVNGVTVEQSDYSHKRRSDYNIEDAQLIGALNLRIATALRPMIKRAFQFDITRIERHLVARYDGADGGHFAAHRDNTTKGTAHRRFACTINLNADEFEGGDLVFPEFGRQSYRAPTGGAVIFSCSLLHMALPVTKGRRYAFLPFFYDDEGARIREGNMAHVAPDLQGYQSGLAPEAAS